MYAYIVGRRGFCWDNEEIEVLEISLLGGMEINVCGEPIQVDSNYVRALLTFLAIENHRPHHREVLAEMFWPERPEGVARNSLKQALSNLRKVLGDRENSTPYLLISRDDVQFNQSSDYRIDAVTFAEQIAAPEEHPHDDLARCNVCEGHLQQALDLYRGDFLSAFYLPDNQDFNDWIILKREVFQRQVSDALNKLALIYEAQGEIGRAVEYSRQLAEIEPWNEENHRNLMRLLALNGMRCAALRQYQICCDCLEKELGVEPSNATITLYEEIKACDVGTFPIDNQLPSPGAKTEQPFHSEEDTITRLAPDRKLTWRTVVALVIAGFIFGIGSVYSFGASRYPVAAIEPNDGDAYHAFPVSTETDGVISALTAIALTAEAKESNVTTTPVSSETTASAEAMASASSATNSLESQLRALVAIYEQTDGSHWENSGGWLSDLSPCEWYGVTCRGEKIVELELDHNQLSGTFPAEIGRLGYLENLDLRNNHLSGNLPPEFGNLANLKQLYLSGNRELSGPIPPELGNLSELEDLELAHWENGGSLLSGEIPPELGNLKKLRSLSISVSLLSGPLPVELCALTNLEDLHLDSNRLNGPIPPEIGNLLNLGGLDLGGNDFEGSIPSELGNLSMLEYLALGGTISGEVPAEFGNLVRLRYLVLDSTNLSGPLPLSLMNLNLRELTFFGTDVCEPPDEDFQAWLDTIDNLWSSEIVCE